tara:strand:+ start:25 stop:570 length:546 start_codon:yes stop_codon:yes gene_type:complete
MTTTITGSGGVSQVQDGSIGTADFAANAITVAKLPTGSVLQVIEATHKLDGSDGNTAVSTGSYVTVYSGTITPSSTSSKILVKLTASLQAENNVTSWPAPQVAVNVFRGSTEMWHHGSGAYYYHRQNVYATHYHDAMLSLEKLDSPSSTSAVQYDVKLRVHDGATSGRMKGSALILMEIAG